MTRQFRRQLTRIRLRTAAQKRCPADFARRILAAYVAHPAAWNGRAAIGHDPRCMLRCGGTCDCDITLSLPDGQIVTVDETRQ